MCVCVCVCVCVFGNTESQTTLEVLLQMGITPLTFDGYAVKSVKLQHPQPRMCVYAQCLLMEWHL